MKIKRDDTVLIVGGDDKGKKGKVIHVSGNRVQVEGANIQKKHVRGKKEGEKGQIIEKPGFMSLSNVKLICPKCNKPTRVGFTRTEKNKLRTCKKCNTTI